MDFAAACAAGCAKFAGDCKNNWNLRSDYSIMNKKDETKAEEMKMGTKGKGQKEVYAARLTKANRAAMNCHLITATVLSIAYLAEVIKGSKGVFYFLLVVVLGFVPVALEFLFYKIRTTHPLVKYLVPWGYGALYITILFTTDNGLAFVYILPMLVAITVYNDTLYSLEIGTAVVLANIVHVFIFYGKGGFDTVEIASAEIQIAVLVMVAAFSYYAAKVSFRMNQIEIDKAENEREHSEELLGRILQVSSDMTEAITDVSREAEELGISIQSTQSAMDELTSGANDTAEAVQRQLVQTEAIAGKVDLVKEVSGQIAGNMAETQAAIHTGNEHVGRLVEQVAQTEQTNMEVAAELGQLKNYMEQMFSIIEMIHNITSQTSLLSLNASIEAARAGEAGRGFAVVASEISGLASQTKDATVKIESLIQNVSGEIGKVVTIIESMIGQVKKQNEAVGEAAQSFEQISANAENIERHSDSLIQVVEELEEANGVISESIQTISAISEEVAAHTNTTYTSCVENEKTIGQLIGQAEDLKRLAEKLNQ